MFELTIAGKDGHVMSRFEMAGDRSIKIGRGPSCDVQVPLASVSREHAAIEPLDDRNWIIRDLGSTHGCSVRGQRIRELAITPGLVVELGPSAVLKFEEMTSKIGSKMAASIPDDDDRPVRILGTLLPDDTLR